MRFFVEILTLVIFVLTSAIFHFSKYNSAFYPAYTQTVNSNTLYSFLLLICVITGIEEIIMSFVIGFAAKKFYSIDLKQIGGLVLLNREWRTAVCVMFAHILTDVFAAMQTVNFSSNVAC